MALAWPIGLYFPCQIFNQNANISLDFAEIMADNKIDDERRKKGKFGIKIAWREVMGFKKRKINAWLSPSDEKKCLAVEYAKAKDLINLFGYKQVGHPTTRNGVTYLLLEKKQ
jgi:hypothetical protein